MTTIKQADWEAASAFVRSDDCPITAKMTMRPTPLAEAFARHREAAEREALERAAEYFSRLPPDARAYTNATIARIIGIPCPTPRPDDSEADNGIS